MPKLFLRPLFLLFKDIVSYLFLDEIMIGAEVYILLNLFGQIWFSLCALIFGKDKWKIDWLFDFSLSCILGYVNQVLGLYLKAISNQMSQNLRQTYSNFCIDFFITHSSHYIEICLLITNKPKSWLLLA